ncbi:MAG: hypothetical protein ACXWJR_01885 [Xanthobacteraceae bacterium]
MTAIARCPGIFSDRIRRGRMYLIGAATTGVFGFVYFGLRSPAPSSPRRTMRDYTGKDIDGECH